MKLCHFYLIYYYLLIHVGCLIKQKPVRGLAAAGPWPVGRPPAGRPAGKLGGRAFHNTNTTSKARCFQAHTNNYLAIFHPTT